MKYSENHTYQGRSLPFDERARSRPHVIHHLRLNVLFPVHVSALTLVQLVLAPRITHEGSVLGNQAKSHVTKLLSEKVPIAATDDPDMVLWVRSKLLNDFEDWLPEKCLGRVLDNVCKGSIIVEQ